MFDAKRHNSSLAVFQAFTAVRFQDVLHVRYQTHPRVFGNLTLNILCSLENNVVRKALEAYEQFTCQSQLQKFPSVIFVNSQQIKNPEGHF